MNTLQPILDFYREHGGESAWTKDRPARDTMGQPCAHDCAEARSWCLIGAMSLIPDNDTQRLVLAELRARIVAFMKHGELVGSVAVWQDSPNRTWADIETILKLSDSR